MLSLLTSLHYDDIRGCWRGVLGGGVISKGSLPEPGAYPGPFAGLLGYDGVLGLSPSTSQSVRQLWVSKDMLLGPVG